MDPAEKQGIVDGALTFFGSLGGGTFAQSIGVAGFSGSEPVIVGALIAGAISGFQSYRRASGLSTATPPVATP